MVWLLWITTILLVMGVGGVATMKLTNNEEVVKQANRLGYERIRKSTGIAELLGVTGVVAAAINTDLLWLGILSAAGIVGMMLGAIGYHRRARDTWPTIPSVVMLILSVLYVVALDSI